MVDKVIEDRDEELHMVHSVQEAPATVLEEGTLDPVYEAKAKVLNKAIQDIGMGKYQWQVINTFKSLVALGNTPYGRTRSLAQRRLIAYIALHSHWFWLGLR